MRGRLCGAVLLTIATPAAAEDSPEATIRAAAVAYLYFLEAERRGMIRACDPQASEAEGHRTGVHEEPLEEPFAGWARTEVIRGVRSALRAEEAGKCSLDAISQIEDKMDTIDAALRATARGDR